MNIKLYDQLSIVIPDGFAEMEAQERSAYYGAMVPDYAYVEREKKAAIAVVHTQTKLADEAVENQICAYRQHYSRMVPGYVQGDLRKKNIAGHCMAIMSYGSNAPDRNLYNILAITVLGGRELIFLFSCDMNDSISYMSKFLATLNSCEASAQNN